MLEYIQRFFGLLEGPTFGSVARSPKFAQLSRNMIKQAGGLCAFGLHKPTLLNPLNSHHVLPFHVDETEELNPDNLIVVCRFHHYAHCHFFNWKDSNPDVRKDAANFNAELQAHRNLK